jgi:hypothetical protein
VAKGNGLFVWVSRAYSPGKTARVTGTLTRYNDRPEMLVKDPKQVQVVAP